MVTNYEFVGMPFFPYYEFFFSAPRAPSISFSLPFPKHRQKNKGVILEHLWAAHISAKIYYTNYTSNGDIKRLLAVRLVQ